jgi:hypothetical protein
MSTRRSVEVGWVDERMNARRVAVRVAGACVAATLALSCSRAPRELPHPALAASGPAPASAVASALVATTAPQPEPPSIAATLAVAPRADAAAPLDVTLSGLVPEGARYWIAVVEPEQPETAWGRWQWVEPGTTTLSLPSPGPGRFEVRLHAHHPLRESDVVARADVADAVAKAP